MPTVTPDPRRIHAFADAAAFEKWLAAHHDREPEVWIKIHKKASGRPTITPAEAIDVALCWGWIDAIRKSFDEESFLQRYTPRTRSSSWSQINRDHVDRLTKNGRMTEHGQREVDRAKADGRWDAAYGSSKGLTIETLDGDLRAALDASPRAKKTLAALSKQNLFALMFRTSRIRTAEGRKKKIAELVATLARGEPIVRDTRAPVAKKRNANKTKAKNTKPKAKAKR
jgi:uncharacterized protein YdeI (YjbR/CyaY-like superfamily)